MFDPQNVSISTDDNILRNDVRRPAVADLRGRPPRPSTSQCDAAMLRRRASGGLAATAVCHRLAGGHPSSADDRRQYGTTDCTGLPSSQEVEWSCHGAFASRRHDPWLRVVIPGGGWHRVLQIGADDDGPAEDRRGAGLVVTREHRHGPGVHAVTRVILGHGRGRRDRDRFEQHVAEHLIVQLLDVGDGDALQVDLIESPKVVSNLCSISLLLGVAVVVLCQSDIGWPAHLPRQKRCGSPRHVHRRVTAPTRAGPPGPGCATRGRVPRFRQRWDRTRPRWGPGARRCFLSSRRPSHGRPPQPYVLEVCESARAREPFASGEELRGHDHLVAAGEDTFFRSAHDGLDGQNPRSSRTPRAWRCPRATRSIAVTLKPARAR